MQFKIPFTFSSPDVLIKKSKPFMMRKKPKNNKLGEYLKDCGTKIETRQYHAICRRSFVGNILSLSIFPDTETIIFSGIKILLQ